MVAYGKAPEAPLYPPMQEKQFNAEEKEFSSFKGILYSALSSVFFSLCAVIVKLLDNMDPGQLAIYRFAGIFIISLPLVIHSRKSVLGTTSQRPYLILRGVFGSTNLFLNFVAFQNLPIGEASVIIFSLPVFVSIMARVFLKEPCGMSQALAIVCTIMGLFLITKFPFNGVEVLSSKRLIGIISALSSLIFGASVFILLRKLKDVHQFVVLFNFSWIALVETTLLTALLEDFSLPSCGIEQFLVLVLGFFSFSGQLLVTLATKCEQAGPVSTVRSAMDIALALLWQIVIFQELPDEFGIAGTILVCLSVGVIGFQKQINDEKMNNLNKN